MNQNNFQSRLISYRVWMSLEANVYQFLFKSLGL